MLFFIYIYTYIYFIGVDIEGALHKNIFYILSLVTKNYMVHIEWGTQVSWMSYLTHTRALNYPVYMNMQYT